MPQGPSPSPPTRAPAAREMRSYTQRCGIGHRRSACRSSSTAQLQKKKKQHDETWSAKERFCCTRRAPHHHHDSGFALAPVCGAVTKENGEWGFVHMSDPLYAREAKGARWCPLAEYTTHRIFRQW